MRKGVLVDKVAELALERIKIVASSLFFAFDANIFSWITNSDPSHKNLVDKFILIQEVFERLL